MQTNDVSGSTLQFGTGEAVATSERPVGRSIKRGFLSRCPACDTGRLFRSFLRSVDNCAACGEDYTHQRADDLPPYITITIVGHIVVAGYMATDLNWEMSSWQHLAIWVPITIILSLLLMQPIKGAVIGLQWAVKMHGFDGKTEETPETGTLIDRTV